MNKFSLEDLAWVDAQRLRDEARGVVLVPFGSTEGHGHHCPLGTDTFMAKAVVEQAAERANVAFSPMIPIGFSPQHLEGRPGTLTVREDILVEYLYDVCRSLIAGGWTKLVLLNGHEGNIPAVWKVLRRIKYDTGALGVGVDVGVMMKTMVTDLIENPPKELPYWHASEIETSLMLAIEKERVIWDRAKAEYPHTPKVVSGSKKFVQDSGFSKTIKFAGYDVFMAQENAEYSDTSTVGNPMRATVEKGRRMLERFVAYTADVCMELKAIEVKVHTVAFPGRV